MAVLLDHLKRVSSKADVNKMTSQNLAVCFGPVVLCPSPQAATDMETALDFKKHIEVLHYLLDIWPENRGELGLYITRSILLSPLPIKYLYSLIVRLALCCGSSVMSCNVVVSNKDGLRTTMGYVQTTRMKAITYIFGQC